MSRTRRCIKFVALGMTMVMVVMSMAASADAAVVRPNHLVTCEVGAVVPQQYYPGTIVTGTGHIMCNSAPDVSNTTVIVWRYIGGGHYNQIVHKTYNQTGTDWWLIAQVGCDYSRAFPMHTQVLIDYFHGNWAHDSANSDTVTMWC